MPEKVAVLARRLTPVRFAPLFIDWAFKIVFGKPAGIPLLVALLNDFLRRVLRKPIKAIRYVPTELLGVAPNSKKVIFDILCEDGTKSTYLLEMQNAKLKNADNRLRLYIARIQSENIDKGNKSYHLPSSFFIGILNYKRDNGKSFFTEEGWVNLQTKKLVSKKEFKIFVELPKFKKKASECKTFRDKIVFLFKNLHLLEERPSNFGEKIFDRLFSVTEICRLNKEELKSYRYSMRYVDERKLAIDCAVEDATIAVARQSKRQRSQEIATAMLADGLEPAFIARYTKLPLRQISRLR
ncbi:MAG: Rpn family recombination-promoting nuclease/putative transposase [Fibromonadales bacterium]|nr:Rpn family recombination-promoting nuclease/putative transposase [Fibromonadales bacterium]